MSCTVRFRNLDDGSSVELTLYSKYTCLYGKESGEGKTHFFSFIEDQLSLNNMEIEISNPLYKFTTANSANLNNFLDIQDRFVIMIDESAMLNSNVIKKIHKSNHLFICISRAVPFKMEYNMKGIYVVNRYREDNNTYFDINPIEQLPTAKVFSKEFDTVLVESATDRSEHQLFSKYLDNVVPAQGRDKLERYLRGQNSTLVFADLGNIGKAYSLLKKRCDKNQSIKFYDYLCFEQLLHESSLVKKYSKPVKVDKFNCISLEQYFEKVLEEETKGTPLSYTHGKNLSQIFLNKGNFYSIFDSDLARGIREYIETFGSIN